MNSHNEQVAAFGMAHFLDGCALCGLPGGLYDGGEGFLLTYIPQEGKVIHVTKDGPRCPLEQKEMEL